MLAGWQSSLHSTPLFHTLFSAKIPALGQKRLGWLEVLGKGKKDRRELGDRGWRCLQCGAL